MKTLAERLRYAMEVLPPKKIKGVDLARAVGVRPPSVSDWLSGKSKTMEGENLLKASNFLGVNANWLATGSGLPRDKSKQSFKDDELSGIIFRDFNLYKIPVYDYAQAALWKDTDSKIATPLGYTFTDYIGSSPEAIFSVIVQGDSMLPDFKAGDVLIIDTSLPPKPGCYVLAQNSSNEAIFNKYRVISQDKSGKDIFELVPSNEDYPTMSSKTNQIRIIGIIVRHIKDFKY